MAEHLPAHLPIAVLLHYLQCGLIPLGRETVWACMCFNGGSRLDSLVNAYDASSCLAVGQGQGNSSCEAFSDVNVSGERNPMRWRIVSMERLRAYRGSVRGATSHVHHHYRCIPDIRRLVPDFSQRRSPKSAANARSEVNAPTPTNATTAASLDGPPIKDPKHRTRSAKA